MSEWFDVTELTVEASRGSADEDPHAQGFFGISASLTTTDPALTATLRRAAHTRARIGWRCVLLETTGWISKVEDGATGTKFVLAVDDLTYHPPVRRPNE